MNDPSSQLLILQIAIAVAAIVCSLALIRKALSFHAKLWVAATIFLVSTAIFSYLSIHIPLYFLAGSERIQHHLTVDVMMFGAAGLIVIAILGFTIDHMYERTNWLIVAAAASISIGIFPFLYRQSQDSLNRKYQITIVEPEQLKNSEDQLVTPSLEPAEINNAGNSDDRSTSEGT